MSQYPVLFIGHGSPMNAVENNAFTQGWESMRKDLSSKPQFILMISAHWYVSNTAVTTAENPQMIYDIYGFPKEIYALNYPAPGAPRSAEAIKQYLESTIEGVSVQLTEQWGLDHGTWSVLLKLYPEADIPVLQLSIDYSKPARWHYHLGQALKGLRDQCLIIGSGNVVHSFKYLDWHMEGGHPWAEAFDQSVHDLVLASDHDTLIHYDTQLEHAAKAFQTPDHYLPLLYILGASDSADDILVYNKVCAMGSMSMTSYLFRQK